MLVTTGMPLGIPVVFFWVGGGTGSGTALAKSLDNDGPATEVAGYTDKVALRRLGFSPRRRTWDELPATSVAGLDFAGAMQASARAAARAAARWAML